LCGYTHQRFKPTLAEFLSSVNFVEPRMGNAPQTDDTAIG